MKAGTATDSSPAGIARHGWRVLLILSTLMGFASISTDTYLSAMPTMALALHTSPGAVDWTISSYLVGFAIGQLFWGPVGDRIGRRIPVRAGTIVFIIGSAGCALAGNIWVIIAWRILQAIGASAGVVLGRAMVRDLYEGRRAAQMMSTLMTVMMIAPLVGPLLGGQVLLFAGWREIFWMLVIIGAFVLLALLALPETLPPERRSDIRLTQAFVRYGELLRNRRLLGYAGAGGFFYAGTFAYVAGTPFAYISYYHVPPQYYGLLFAASMIFIMSATTLNSRLVHRLGGDRLMRRGTAAAACIGLALAVVGYTSWLGLPGLVAPLFIFMGLNGFVVANSISGALSDFPTRSGAVSALVGAMQYGSGIIGSALVGAFADGTPWPMTWIMALAGIGSFLCARLVKTPG